MQLFAPGDWVVNRFSGIEGHVQIVTTNMTGYVWVGVRPMNTEDKGKEPDLIYSDQEDWELRHLAHLERPDYPAVRPQAIPLGSKVRDIVTGFEGIATSCTEHFNYCITYGVESEVKGKDGKSIHESFNSNRLKVVGPGVTEMVQPRQTGPTSFDSSATRGM